jgi:hypothetical protein
LAIGGFLVAHWLWRSHAAQENHNQAVSISKSEVGQQLSSSLLSVHGLYLGPDGFVYLRTDLPLFPWAAV